MLRLLSIRNFVVVEALDLEVADGFSVLTGETGAGKSILLDALALLLGDRFELRQLKPGAERAELAAAFDVEEDSGVVAWLAEQGMAADAAPAETTLLLRRTQDAQGKSRAWINGRPATLAQLKEVGEMLVDLHGQNAHQSLLAADAQRALLDAFGGFTALARETASAWREWRTAAGRRDAASAAARESAAERDLLEARRRELAALGVTADEWTALSQAQTRLAHAAALLEAATAAEDELTEADAALVRRLAVLIAKLDANAVHDPALAEIVALLEPARIELDEAAREIRAYRDKLDLDPAELARVEQRLAALHDVARKYRVRPEGLRELLAETEARLQALGESADADALERREAEAEADFRALAAELSTKRTFAAHELQNRVTIAMQELAMKGGRLEIALPKLAQPASYGNEQVEFRVASHPKQPLGPLAKVASGGELSRIALAIEVVTSDVGEVPTLVFDEVDVGIGGAVAATVGRLLQSLGNRRQVLCVTHLPQFAAFADAHFRVTKHGDETTVRAEVEPLESAASVEELARMLAGSAITAKTRAHAKELLEQHRRATR
ncbi:MAG TPA: DNA repair protein RecN [Casimicrobiaceae bacterium]